MTIQSRFLRVVTAAVTVSAGLFAYSNAMADGAMAESLPGEEPLPVSELTDEEQAKFQQMHTFWESLDRKTGDVKLPGGLVTLHVPDEYYFLGGRDSERVLVDLWGNPPGQAVLGMLFPAHYTPFDSQAWAVTVEYDDQGHVSDADAADIDYDDLLRSMQDDIRDSNAARREAGYEEVRLLGWAEAPHYDAAHKQLYWAKVLRCGDAPETTLNYEIRKLGRQGVLRMTFIAGTPQLAEINDSRDGVLAMAEFNPGHTYAEFDPGMDKVAAYGIGALIAGKVAAKTGLLAGGLLLLKKFGVFILLALAAGVSQLRKLIGRGATD